MDDLLPNNARQPWDVPMPYIECINTKDDSRKYFAITKPIVSIGSKSGNDILLIKGDVDATTLVL